MFDLMYFTKALRDEIYNCSEKSMSKWFETGEKHVVYGVISVIYGILAQVLYLPCIITMTSGNLFKLSCFKFMFFLGIADMTGLFVNSIVHGYLSITGAVFCTNPTLIFYSGAVGTSIWSTACMLCLILVIDRVFEIWKPVRAVNIFGGNHAYYYILFAYIYGFLFFLFTPPVLFNSKHQSWFFDPFIYHNKSNMYQNPAHTFNNLFLVGTTCGLYTFFCIALRKKLRIELQSQNAGTVHRRILFQASLICFISMGASIVYVIMQFCDVPTSIIVLGHVGWQLAQGCPGPIYLLLNPTIRNGVRRLFGCMKMSVSNIYSSTFN